MRKVWDSWLDEALRAPKLDESVYVKPKAAARRDEAKTILKAYAKSKGLVFKNVYKYTLWAFVDKDGILAGKKKTLGEHREALEKGKYYLFSFYV